MQTHYCIVFIAVNTVHVQGYVFMEQNMNNERPWLYAGNSR